MDRRFRETIEFTDDHRKLAARLNVQWQEEPYWGTTEVGNAKRPFGNGGMPMDVAEILEWDIFEDADGERHLTHEQHERAERLYFEMGYVVKELLKDFGEGN